MVNMILDIDPGLVAEESAKRLRDMGARMNKSDTDPSAPWFSIQNKADDPTVAQIDIYDEISWFWGVSAVDFRSQLKALGDDVSTIDLHINSPGGDVYEAIAIMNTLRQHDARVVTTVDGYAASSAGFIAVGASDELIVAENAEIMAHLPWAVMVGDAAEMRKMADDLERIGKNIASIFQARAGGTLDEWVSILTDETWWSADEAVAAGIADSVMKMPKKKSAKDSARNRFDLSIFNHAGRSAAPAPRNPQAHTETPQPVEVEGTDGKPNAKEPTVALSESALQKLGLDADADEDAINAAIDALPLETEGEAPAEPTVEQATQIAAKAGLTVLDSATATQLAADAAAGREALARQTRDDDERIVNSAIAAGKIPPARKDHWLNALEADREGNTAVLNSLQANLIPVAPIGHGVTNEAASEDNLVYSALFGTGA